MAFEWLHLSHCVHHLSTSFGLLVSSQVGLFQSAPCKAEANAGEKLWRRNLRAKFRWTSRSLQQLRSSQNNITHQRKNALKQNRLAEPTLHSRQGHEQRNARCWAQGRNASILCQSSRQSVEILGKCSQAMQCSQTHNETVATSSTC